MLGSRGSLGALDAVGECPVGGMGSFWSIPGILRACAGNPRRGPSCRRIGRSRYRETDYSLLLPFWYAQYTIVGYRTSEVLHGTHHPQEIEFSEPRPPHSRPSGSLGAGAGRGTGMFR